MATPHSDSLRIPSWIAGKLICARFEYGTPTIGNPLPSPSTSRPSSRVSEIPAAHLAIELPVSGAAMMPSAGGSTSGVPGSLYSLRTG